MKPIKKEIVISAPPSEVWEHITDPRKVEAWLMRTDINPEVGKEFSLDCGEEGTISCVVKEVIPFQKLVYSFRSRAMKAETLVTITLAKEGKNTRLTLIHSGWDALPPDQQDSANNFDDGWNGFLRKLQQLASNVGSK